MLHSSRGSTRIGPCLQQRLQTAQATHSREQLFLCRLLLGHVVECWVDLKSEPL